MRFELKKMMRNSEAIDLISIENDSQAYFLRDFRAKVTSGPFDGNTFLIPHSPLSFFGGAPSTELFLRAFEQWGENTRIRCDTLTYEENAQNFLQIAKPRVSNAENISSSYTELFRRLSTKKAQKRPPIHDTHKIIIFDMDAM